MRRPSTIALVAAWLALSSAPGVPRVAALAAQATDAPPTVLTLEEVIARAQRSGFASRAARAAFDGAIARNRAFGGGLLPQVSLGGTLPAYNRSIIPVLQPDGGTLFQAQEQSEASLDLSVTQRLPYVGGDLFVRSALSRLDLGGERDIRTWSSTPLLIGLRQELLRPNRLRWETREQRLAFDIADREYREALEDVAISAIGAFFDLYDARRGLENARLNAAVNDTLFTLGKGRFEVGRIGENDLLQSELALLRARNALDAASLREARARAALLLALDLPPATRVELVPPGAPAETALDTLDAVRAALAGRADVRALELAAVRASRGVAEARAANGPGATLQASIGFNQTAGRFDGLYRDLREAQRLSLGVQVPLLQWGVRGGEVAAAESEVRRQELLARLQREQVSQTAHFAVLELAQARRQYELAVKADSVAARRFEVAKNRYLVGRIGIDNLYIAQAEKDQAFDESLRALRGVWLSAQRLRRTTMYDAASGRSLVGDVP